MRHSRAHTLTLTALPGPHCNNQMEAVLLWLLARRGALGCCRALKAACCNGFCAIATPSKQGWGQAASAMCHRELGVTKSTPKHLFCCWACSGAPRQLRAERALCQGPLPPELQALPFSTPASKHPCKVLPCLQAGGQQARWLPGGRAASCLLRA